ncbi:hypothetical protein TNCT_540181 [Trichonephila clavata]|uniref:Uncharacterized protein n=1 Tax=Trichonephila clavata TaxID=2740835 RepID=A0A8X6GP61_TRICU|nr:hypothetical protein TNCT_540181 [Trichonephila clavata]
MASNKQENAIIYLNISFHYQNVDTILVPSDSISSSCDRRKTHTILTPFVCLRITGNISNVQSCFSHTCCYCRR